MRTVILSPYEISKLIKDPSLYSQIPELSPVKDLMSAYSKAVQEAPASSCGGCGGRHKVASTPQASRLLQSAVDMFVGLAGKFSAEGLQVFKKRFQADAIELRYKNPLSNKQIKIIL